MDTNLLNSSVELGSLIPVVSKTGGRSVLKHVGDAATFLTAHNAALKSHTAAWEDAVAALKAAEDDPTKKNRNAAWLEVYDLLDVAKMLQD